MYSYQNTVLPVERKIKEDTRKTLKEGMGYFEPA